MKKGFGWLAAVAIALFAATAPAQAIELVQPAPHSILRGGSFAQLECSLLAVSAGAEEWEAFLSIDGMYRAMGEPGRDPAHPKFADHCFTGAYPTHLTDQTQVEPQPRQLSLLAEAS